MGARTTALAIAMVAIFVVLGGCALADDYYVDGTNGTDDGSHGGSAGTGAWKTITYALGQISGTAADPHTIHIAVGTYAASTNGESYPLNMESYVSLSGEDEATTTLDAKNAAYHVIYCHNDNNFTIENLKITGGNADGSWSDSYGGGIFCDSSSPTLTNCTVSANTAHWGGGIFCDSSSPPLTNCTISGNTASERGGGIYCWLDSSPTLTNCTLSDNTASEYGGGIGCFYDSSPTLTNCTISGNTASEYGGGIYCYSSSPTLTDCTISGNTAGKAGGGIYCSGYDSPRILNSILWGDSPDEIGGDTSYVRVTYSDVEGGWSGTGNIDEDPLFVAGLDGDYYLSHEEIDGVDSPCLDGGYGAVEDYGLDGLTTCRDGSEDGDDDGDGSTGPIDMGLHYPGVVAYYVDAANGHDSNSGENWENALATIAAAIETSHDTISAIHVAAATYVENITLNSYVTLLGGYPPGGGTRDPGENETIIDGGHNGHVVTISDKKVVRIDGFTIQNGSATLGGGIYCVNSDATVTGCTICDNTADEFGGAIYFEASSVEMSDCVVMNNTSEIGGGIFCYDESSVDLLNCMIAHNTADYGAAIYSCWKCTLALRSCTIADNTADGWVGGIYCEAFCNLEVLNSILYGNSTEQVYVSPTSSVDITYSCVQGGYSGEGNIDDDPLFVPTGDPPFEYYLAHTGAQAGDSPCLDAGYGGVADYGLEGTTTCTDGREDGDDDSDGGTGPIDMGYHYPEAYDGQGDTSISLTSFEARPAGSAILVTWETGAEIDSAGFVLFREIAGTQDYRLISGLIPGQGAPASGTSYTFTDTNVEPGITYNYWLVDIETSGNWTAHGPASARAAGIVPSIDPRDSGMVLR